MPQKYAWTIGSTSSMLIYQLSRSGADGIDFDQYLNNPDIPTFLCVIIEASAPLASGMNIGYVIRDTHNRRLTRREWFLKFDAGYHTIQRRRAETGATP